MAKGVTNLDTLDSQNEERLDALCSTQNTQAMNGTESYNPLSRSVGVGRFRWSMAAVMDDSI